MQSDGRLDTDEYMTMLVQFPSKTFNTSNFINHDFEYYLNMAEEGSEKYQGTSKSSGIGAIGLTFVIFDFIPIILIIVFLGIFAKKQVVSNLKFGAEGKKIPSDVAYYRDIPCQKDIFRAYYIGYNYGLLKNKTDILGAIILKWMKDSIIRVEQRESGKIFKKENAVIILNETNPDMIENEQEKEIFKMLYEASKDGILESKEFEKWCNVSYSRILKWFDNILDKQRDILVNEGLIIAEEKTSFKIFTSTIYTATPELKKEAIELAGLKKYLKEYTLIKDREAIEVVIFEEYLIYAQIMGIAKEVAKEFKDIYPEL